MPGRAASLAAKACLLLLQVVSGSRCLPATSCGVFSTNASGMTYDYDIHSLCLDGPEQVPP